MVSLSFVATHQKTCIHDFSVFSLSILGDSDANLVHRASSSLSRASPSLRRASSSLSRASPSLRRASSSLSRNLGVLCLENLGVSLLNISASLLQFGVSESKLVVSLQTRLCPDPRRLSGNLVSISLSVRNHPCDLIFMLLLSGFWFIC